MFLHAHRPTVARLTRLLAAACLCAAAAFAQQPPPATLPDAPSATQAAKPESSPQPGYLVRKSKFFPDLATSPGPLTSGQKFKLFVNDSLSGSALLSSLASAGLGQAFDTHTDFGQGADGFASRFGAHMAQRATTEFVGTYVISSVLHIDPRYKVQPPAGFGTSVKRAVRRLFIAPTDAGGETINWPGLTAPLISEAVANSYLPASERTTPMTFQRYGTDLAARVGGNVMREYWPTLFKKLRLPKSIGNLGGAQPAPPPKQP